MGKVEEINARLNGKGRVILEETKNTGLELPLACALVEQESGGRNIFGCDHGGVGDTPPYCHQQVTRDRVQRLRDGGNYTFGMNGVGLTQLTWWEFVERAEAEGGAHLPQAQCRVGFRLLKRYIDTYRYLEALGAYNAGEGNRQVGIDNGYAGTLAEKHEVWKGILPDEEEQTHPEVNLVPNEDGWLADPQAGKWARARGLPNAVIRTDNNGWLWVSKSSPPLDTFEWPEANDPPIPNSGWYVERHPTRYTWRSDVEAWARWLVQNYDCWVNTYHDHPEGLWRTEDSMDVWGPGGRGDPIDPTLGQQIFGLLFNDPNPLNIQWCIWQATQYGAWNDWLGEPFGEDSFSWHYDHIHVTYLR